MSASILIIEDDQITRDVLRRHLAAPPDVFRVDARPTIADGLRALDAGPVDCVVLDYRLPDGDGLAALRRIHGRTPELPVVMLTGAGSEDVAVEAMKLGAADYVVKHGSYVEGLVGVIREALGRGTLECRTPDEPSPEPLAAEVLARYRAAGIVGDSPSLCRAIVAAERAARSDATVLLEGATGTGKELFARAIHHHGARVRGPFVAVNCAAVTETLLESELFGHVRGAFSGADRDRRGLFEEANGGTLFLDEIGEVSAAIQAKLLRILEDGEVRPVGASRGRRSDARVIAASNRSLRAAVREGRVRLDLYHRLHVFPVVLPALCERRGDVAPLVTHFVAEFAVREGRAPLRIAPSLLAMLERYPWPGNVRELRNEAHRLVLCAEPGGRLEPGMLPARFRDADHLPSRPLKSIVRDVELAIIRERLREHGYRRTATAESLGITREGLWQKLRQLGVKLPSRSAGG